MIRFILLSVCFHLTFCDTQIWHNVFNEMDGNKDQILTQAEFDKVIVAVDINGDGKVPEAEFLQVYHQATGGNHHQGATDKAGHQIFLKGVHNNDGSLTIPELKSIFSAFDYDGNGKTTPDEFKKFWSSIHSRSSTQCLNEPPGKISLINCVENRLYFRSTLGHPHNV